jgi:hypothetical protein
MGLTATSIPHQCYGQESLEIAKQQFLQEIAAAKAEYEKKLFEAEQALQNVFDEEINNAVDPVTAKSIAKKKELFLGSKFPKQQIPTPESIDEVWGELVRTLNSNQWYQHWEPGTAPQGPVKFSVNRLGQDPGNNLRIRMMYVVQKWDSYFILLNGQLRGFHEPTGRQVGYRR